MAVGPLIESTLALLHNQLLADHMDVRLEVEPDLPEIHADPNQIQQVLVNLINNASQAIAPGGRAGELRIRARRWRDGVAVDVIDNGPGMTKSVADQVFDPFFTTKPEGQGTGLGLTICQRIITEQGGRIALVTRPGEGAHVHGGTARGGPASPISRLRVTWPRRPTGSDILLVDDEPHIIHYLRTTLEAWGHRVAAASDGAEGLALAGGQDFDLVICDLRMPRLSGREFYQQLISKNPAMAPHVIFSTGDSVRGDTLAFLEGLGRPWLDKPFSLAELRSALEQRRTPPGSEAPARDRTGRTRGLGTRVAGRPESGPAARGRPPAGGGPHPGRGDRA